MKPEALLEALGLKALPRAGWVRVGVDGPESVAAHSWGVAWLVLALLPPELDLERALAYAVIHDLAEVRVGDLMPTDGVSAADKNAREHRALVDLLDERPDLVALWTRYEGQSDPESRFVRQLDRLDMALQAVWYSRRGGPDLTEFLESASRVIEHPVLTPILAYLRKDPSLRTP